MPTIVVRHLASATLVFFTIWSWTAPLALERAQRAAAGVAIAGVLLSIALLLPKQRKPRDGDDYSWALATALIIAGGAAITIRALGAAAALRS